MRSCEEMYWQPRLQNRLKLLPERSMLLKRDFQLMLKILFFKTGCRTEFSALPKSIDLLDRWIQDVEVSIHLSDIPEGQFEGRAFVGNIFYEFD